MGNAVVNGVYQGSFEVRSCHVKNLSQDPDEAFEKAQEASERMGLKLTTSRDSLREEMNAIHRANAAELERREREQKEREDRWAAERAAEEEAKRQTILGGKFAFGPYVGKEFHEAPRGYISWLIDTLPDFEEGGLMRLTAQEVARRVPHLALPKPKPGLYVGEPKKRQTFDVTVVRRYSFARDAWNGYGIETVHIITMIDKATGACLVAKSGAFYAEEGEELKIKATVKEHAEYRGQAQTVVQRIAVLED
ncbi:hypothetical protein [Pseudomonas virus Yua]|uniref:DNA binding protein n=1 Tax=Pseudomonas phage YuA TaxID=462590 RepID=A9J562_BPPYU|nr:hypothetical protein PPYV_gp43 [Pseudomonas virus Yua]CAO77798.1 hypothetical protein [Pseudomonas virus Yua]